MATLLFFFGTGSCFSQSAKSRTSLPECETAETKYVEKAKQMTMSVFNRSRYQDSVTSLGLNAVTDDQVTLVTDPRSCESINGFMEKWFDLEGDSDVSVFLKVSDYYLIVFVRQTITGFGRQPIYLLTADFKPKTVWLY